MTRQYQRYGDALHSRRERGVCNTASATGCHRPRFSCLQAPDARELDIARLVAHGYSNRGIAEKLVIATGTAERHVANILPGRSNGGTPRVGCA